MTVYVSRYYAKKYSNSGDVIVKVFGGYAPMSARDYRIWKNQK